MTTIKVVVPEKSQGNKHEKKSICEKNKETTHRQHE